MMDPQILIFKVSCDWYQVIKSNFISSGSSITNCWYTKEEESSLSQDDFLPPSSTLSLFLVEEGDKQYIVGGGFFLKKVSLDLTNCWYNFGVRSGYIAYQAFLKRAKECGADENSMLNCYLCNGTFIFIKNNLIHIPQEFHLDFEHKSRYLLSAEEPLGLYLQKIALERRLPQIEPGCYDSTWPGIYNKASVHNNAQDEAKFKARMFDIYNYRCAITGCTFLATLSVATIKNFFDDRYFQPNNALLLRCDLQRLFNLGFITCYYDGEDTIRVRASKRLLLNKDSTYDNLDGQKIFVPKEPVLRPNKEYLEWHNEICFENWLKYGEFSLIDKIPHD